MNCPHNPCFPACDLQKAKDRVRAAAPEMLEALKHGYALMESTRDTLADKYDHFAGRSGDSEFFGKTLEIFKAAIAKAEGK